MPGRSDEPETPDSLLDAIRDHPEWSETRRAECIDTLIARFSPEVLGAALARRMDNLSGGYGEVVIRLVEGLGDDTLLDRLADALVAQPNLSPDRAWEILDILEGSGRIETRPELTELLDEIEGLPGSDETLQDLAAQLETDPDSLELAVEGLESIEPEVRLEIIAGLASGPIGPGVLGLLRRLTESSDPATREAASAGLRQAESGREPAKSGGLAVGEISPSPIASRISELDADGRAEVTIVTRQAPEWIAAAFVCDLMKGIVAARGVQSENRGEIDAFLATVAGRSSTGENSDTELQLALGLLAGAAWLGGVERGDEAATWLERVTGANFSPRPVFAAVEESEWPGDESEADLFELADAIIAAVPTWLDRSPLVLRLAEEIALAEGDAAPDPGLDSGAFRFLFESRFAERVDLYSRMLTWTGMNWMARGRDDLGRAALAIGARLADPQNAVPGDPFLSRLMARSLAAAQEEIVTRREKGPSGLAFD